MQGLIESRGLRKDEKILQIGNGVRVVAITIDIYPLWLLLRFSLVFKDYYCTPAAIKNLISVAVLV